MKSRPILMLCFLMLFGVASIIFLYSFSEETNHKRNGFIRLIPPHTVEPIKVIDLRVNSYTIAGITSNQIYFGNISIPSHLLIANYNLSDTSHFDFIINKDLKNIRYKAPHVYVDSSVIYILDGNIPQVFKGELNKLTLKKVSPGNLPRFTLALPISLTNIILRTYDGKNDENILSNYNLNDSTIHNFPDLLQKQQDGIFSTDGMLTYDNYSNRVIYLYYYRNKFLCFDTTLKLMTTGKTIDTNTVAKITIANIASTKTTTLSSPPLLVNKNCCADNGKLYIQSGLISSNEDQKSFKNCSVIDVYALSNSQYLYSFYIPDLHGKKVKSFCIRNNIIIAMYSHFAETFRLNTSNIKAKWN